MKVMIHKIHMGANLPSVQAGEPYVIYGFRDSINDYSHVNFPQDIRNCVNCHAGSATGAGLDYLTLTSQGDNWSLYATQAACGSCHDDRGFLPAMPAARRTTPTATAATRTGGVAGSIQDSHTDPDK